MKFVVYRDYFYKILSKKKEDKALGLIFLLTIEPSCCDKQRKTNN